MNIQPTLQTAGAQLLREVTDLGFLRSRSAEIYSERERLHASGTMPSELAPFFRRRTIPVAEIADPMALIPNEVARLVSAEFGAAWTVSPDSFLRWIIPGSDDARLPFHQDEKIQGRKLINLWMPLDSCGVEAPGLEVILTPERVLLPVSPPTHPTYAVERAQITEQMALAAGMPWRPIMDPGDALLFLGTTAHRTHILPGMTRARQSVEIRLVTTN